MIHLFYSLMSFFVAVFFIILGLLALLIEAFGHIKEEVIQFLENDTLFISLFGFLSLLIGIGIIFYLLSGMRKRYHTIKSSGGAFYIDENLVKGYLENYWRELFPNQEIPTQVFLRKNHVQITADLPFVPESEQKILLNRIDQDLKEVFRDFLGFDKNYTVSLSFQKPNS